MKISLFSSVLLSILLSTSFSFAQTPVSKYGQLKLKGNQLSSECGNPVQLRGMSSHGLQWHSECLDGKSIPLLISDWKAEMIRLAMYVGEGGYLKDPGFFKVMIDEYTDYISSLGLYCIIDWHVLTPGDPNVNINEAKAFWDYISKRNAGKKGMIYEICNEPNGVDWATVKNYANIIIPIIRANDKESIILVGNPNNSSNIDAPANDPLVGANAYNVMYTFHFYAASHMNKLGNFNTNTAKIPLFVSEWGTSTYSGGGNIDLAGSQQWMDNFNGANAGSVKISWANWSFSDAPESSAALGTDACKNQNYTNLTPSGTKVKYWMSNPPSSNIACVFGPSCKSPNLGNDVSLCGSTNGITLNSGLSSANKTFSWKKDNASVAGTGPTLLVTQPGVYTILSDSAGCKKSDDIIVSASLPPVNLGQAIDLCKPSVATLDAGLSGNGLTYAWKNGNTSIGGNTKTIQVSQAGTYSVSVSISGCPISTGSVVVTSSLPIVSGDTVCSLGMASLKVNGTGTYNWFANSTGGTSLKTGNTYNPQVSNTTTYFVESSAGQDFVAGPSSAGSSPWDVTDYTTSDKKLAIQALANVSIKSISVNASAGQTVTINVTDKSSSAIVKTAAMNVSAGVNVIPINFTMISGKSYSIDGNGSTGALKFLNGSTAVWPQTIANIATISSGEPNYANGWSAFFDITFSTGKACDRVPVVAFVGTCTGLEENEINKSVSKVYPNPFNDNFVLDLGNEFNDVQFIELTDQGGKALLTVNKNQIAPEIQLGQNLANGQYFVRIIRSGKVEIKSVIKLK